MVLVFRRGSEIEEQHHNVRFARATQALEEFVFLAVTHRRACIKRDTFSERRGQQRAQPRARGRGRFVRVGDYRDQCAVHNAGQRSEGDAEVRGDRGWQRRAAHPSPDGNRPYESEHEARQHDVKRHRRSDQMNPARRLLAPRTILPANRLDIGYVGNGNPRNERCRAIDDREKRTDTWGVEERALPAGQVVERDAAHIESRYEADPDRYRRKMEKTGCARHQQRPRHFEPFFGEAAECLGKRHVVGPGLCHLPGHETHSEACQRFRQPSPRLLCRRARA